jgi:hypothetical protein
VLHNKELHNLYASINIIILTKSKRMEWWGMLHAWEMKYIRGRFEIYVDSHYYSESELCGGAVMVFFRSTSLGKR